MHGGAETRRCLGALRKELQNFFASLVAPPSTTHKQMAPHQSPSLDSRGRAKINEPGEKLDGGEHTLEDLMAQLDSIPANKRILRQIGVRDSVMRCLSAKARHLAQEEMKDERVLALVCSLLGWEMVGAGEGPCKPLQQEPALAGF